jgi:hypothetical protein
LDEVDWPALQHAYGSAADVPDQLRALASGTRGDPLERLYGTIFHQGKRYEASVDAVPFLAGIAADPATANRAAVLGLLASLTVGYDENWLPGGMRIAAERAGLTRRLATDPEQERREVAAWVAQAADDRERRGRAFAALTYDPAQARLSRQWAVDTYDAVRAELSALVPLLDDGDAEVRTATAYLLAWFPEEAEALRPRLSARADDESDPTARATAILACGLLTEPGSDAAAARFAAALAADDVVVRTAAAIAVARVAGPAGPPAGVIDVLLDALAAGPHDLHSFVPFLDGDLRGYAALALQNLGGDPAGLVAAVAAALPGTPAMPALTLISTLLATAFPDGPRPPGVPFTALTPVQQRAVTALAHSERAWTLGRPGAVFVNLAELVRSYGLPDRYADLRAYAALE